MTIGRIPGATGIQPTIVDAKGDIIAATAADSVTRLAVGANDTVLTADSSTATGLKWAAPASGGMTLISTTTLSGASTTITVAANSYRQLMAIAEGIDASVNHNPYIQINSVTGATAYRPMIYGNASTAGIITATNGIFLNFPGSQGFGTSNNNVCITTFYNPNSTTMQAVSNQSAYFYDVDSTISTQTNNVAVNPAAVISSLVYKTDSSFTAGTVKVYGVN
jgi:hypothetical protein